MPLSAKKVFSGLAAILVATIICLVALEVLTRITYSIRMDYQIEMSRYAAAMKREAGRKLSHTHQPNSEDTLMGVQVTTNSHGFRDTEYPIEKPAGTYRIMLLGDSLTFGWGVEAEARFGNLLEKKINEYLKQSGSKTKVQIVNTGIGNYNTVQEVNLFKGLADQWRPDMVIINYFINDAEMTPVKRLPKFIKYSYLAMWIWGRLDTLSRMWGEGPGFKEYYSDLYGDDQPGWINSKKALKELVGLTKLEKINLVLAILPELHSTGENYFFKQVHRKITEAAQSSGIENIVDVTPGFTGQEPSSMWVSPDDAHPNAAAHAIIATGLFDYLKKKALLPK